MQHVDNFFNKHILVNFHGGAMGTFLCNLLSDNDSGFYKECKELYVIGVQESYEWVTLDCFNQIAREKSNAKEKFQLRFKDQWEKYYLYAYAVIFSKTYANHMPIEQVNTNVANIDDIDKILNERIDFDRVYFPAIKSHPFNHPHYDIFKAKNLNWKHKLQLYFPEDKRWIQCLLLLWKAWICDVDNVPHFDPTRSDPNTGLFKYFTELMSSNQLTDFSMLEIPKLDDNIQINMYDLIFKKDITEIKQAIPDFDFTDSKRTLLETAHITSIEILKKLGFDHSISVREPIRLNDFLKGTKLPDYIEQYIKMSKK